MSQSRQRLSPQPPSGPPDAGFGMYVSSEMRCVAIARIESAAPPLPATFQAIRPIRFISGIIRGWTALQATHARWIVRNYDLEFLKHFSMVIVFLGTVTFGLILFAHHLNGKAKRDIDPGVQQRLLARIAPVGEVYAGATGAAAQAEALKAAAAAATASVAYGGTMDGSVVFGNLCTGCHTSGAGGAPKLDAAGIGARVAAQGLDMLIKNAITGYTGTAGVMPAKGGNPALTDDQVKATVEWMVSQSK